MLRCQLADRVKMEIAVHILVYTLTYQVKPLINGVNSLCTFAYLGYQLFKGDGEFSLDDQYWDLTAIQCLS